MQMNRKQQVAVAIMVLYFVVSVQASLAWVLPSEEDILFRDLARKNMSAEHLKIMNELAEEHAAAR